MKIKDVMTRNVESISPDATIESAARRMRDKDIGVLTVKTDDSLIGILTDRDIVLRSTAEGEDPASKNIAKIMNFEIESCYENDDIERAVEIMEKYKVRRLPVLNRTEKLVGIISLSDMMAHGIKAQACDAFEKLSETSQWK
jgi:CBS domain-containing protein